MQCVLCLQCNAMHAVFALQCNAMHTVFAMQCNVFSVCTATCLLLAMHCNARRSVFATPLPFAQDLHAPPLHGLLPPTAPACKSLLAPIRLHARVQTAPCTLTRIHVHSSKCAKPPPPIHGQDPLARSQLTAQKPWCKTSHPCANSPCTLTHPCAPTRKCAKKTPFLYKHPLHTHNSTVKTPLAHSYTHVHTSKRAKTHTHVQMPTLQTHNQHRNPGANPHIHAQAPLAHSCTPSLALKPSVQNPHPCTGTPCTLTTNSTETRGTKLHAHVQTPLAHSHTCTQASVQNPTPTCKCPPCKLTISTETLVQNSTPTCKHPLHTHAHPQAHTQVCKHPSVHRNPLHTHN